MNNIKKNLLCANIKYYIVLFIPLLIYTVFFIIPNVQTMIYSFFEWNGISPTKTFVGLDNYATIFFGKTQFWSAFLNTIFYTTVLFVLAIVLGLMLALALNKNTWYNIFFRGIFFAPGILSTIAVGFMWKIGIYDYNIGFLNQFLSFFNLDQFATTWIGDEQTALFCIVVVHVWTSVGFCMVMFISGINEIPESVYEACKMEGAGGVATLFKITLPLLKPTMSTVGLLTLINGFTAFDFVYTMTESGGAGGMTEVLATLLYRQGFTYSKVGISSSIAVVLTILVLTFTVVQKKIFAEKE